MSGDQDSWVLKGNTVWGTGFLISLGTIRPWNSSRVEGLDSSKGPILVSQE